MAKKKWDFDPFVTGGNEDARDELKRARSKKWKSNDQYPSSFADLRHQIETAFNYSQLADSLTEPARKQLLDDLAGWDEATWEHRQHPPKPRHPSEGHSENGP